MAFPPVVDFSTVRICLSIAVMGSYHVEQMCVKTLFLYGDIEGNVYVSAPPGLDLCSNDLVLKLRQSLYGLNQAPVPRYRKWEPVVSKLGFRQLQ